MSQMIFVSAVSRPTVRDGRGPTRVLPPRNVASPISTLDSSDVRSGETAKEQPGGASRHDDERLGDLPQLDERKQRDGEDDDGGKVDQRGPPENVSGSGDRAGC